MSFNYWQAFEIRPKKHNATYTMASREVQAAASNGAHFKRTMCCPEVNPVRRSLMSLRVKVPHAIGLFSFPQRSHRSTAIGTARPGV